MLDQPQCEEADLFWCDWSPCTNVVRDAREAQRHVASAAGGEHEKEFL
jgi:hypothetical protein